MNPEIITLYNHFKKNPIVTTDSRNVPDHSIFFALKGENFDGNQYASQALKKGASLAVVNDMDRKGKDRYFYTKDVLKTLQDLAAYHRALLKATIIGITGTNGKTTTKELINAVLSKKYKCRATSGNLNNHIGVPLTLLSFSNSLEFGIVEMGANHPGEIAALSAIAQPEFGLITNVGKAHLQGFGSFEGVIKTKTELYNYIKTNKGKVFLNASNQILKKQALDISTIEYGDGTPVTARVISGFPLLELECSVYDEKFTLNTNLVGSYNLENILAAVTIGHFFGVETPEIKSAIENYTPENNRSQVYKTDRNTLILDAYNANPSSMEVSIKNFATGDLSNKVLILGEMLELGEVAESEHKKLVNSVMDLKPEAVFFVGQNFKSLNLSEQHVFGSTIDLISYLKDHPIRNKTILIKGSRGNKLEQIVELL